MKKTVIISILLFLFFPWFHQKTNAVDLLTIDSSGQLIYSSSGQVEGTTNQPPGKALGQEKSNKFPPVNKTLKIEPTGNQLKLKLEQKTQTGYQDKAISSSGELEIEPSTQSSKIQIRANNNAAYVIRNKIAAQSRFPLMVNLETNELIVTTPKGSKVVTILPDQAVQHMLAANVLDQAGGKGGLLWLESQEATMSPTPISEVEVATEETVLTSEPIVSPNPTETPTNGTITDQTILLTQNQDGTLVYDIPGIKEKKLFGIWKLVLKRTAVVSAETGELLKVRQDLLSKLADILSTN